jgi:hypothetical protein
MSNQQEENVLSETESFIVWRTEEEEGYLYHIELGGITLHMTSEEWEEFVTLMKSVE